MASFKDTLYKDTYNIAIISVMFTDLVLTTAQMLDVT